MTIVVEDGTGLANADAFVSVAWFRAWADARGKANIDFTDEEIEQAIVRASDYLSESFAWAGYRLNERGAAGGRQALAWPRVGVTDKSGYGLPSDEVPAEVQKATAEIVVKELASPGAMAPVYNAQERVKSERFGSVAFEYDMSNTSAHSARPVILAVMDLIGEFLAAGASNSIVGEAVRA